MVSGPATHDKLKEITVNRMKLSLCLIMIIEHGDLTLDELIKLTGYEFKEINRITKDLVRLNLIEIRPSHALPLFKMIDAEESREYLKLLEENFYLDALE